VHLRVETGPTSTGAGGSDPLGLCWRGEGLFSRSRWGTLRPHPSGVNGQLTLGQPAITNRDTSRAKGGMVQGLACVCNTQSARRL